MDAETFVLLIYLIEIWNYILKPNKEFFDRG